MELITNIKVWTETGDEKASQHFADEHIEVGKSNSIWVRNKARGESEFIEFLFLTFDLDFETKKMTTYQIHTEKPSPFGRGFKFRVKSIDRDLQAVTFEAL